MQDCMVSKEEREALVDIGEDSLGVIVEIGSYRGMTALALAERTNNPVFCIDPHQNFTGPLGATFGPGDRQTFFENVSAECKGHQISLINLRSLQACQVWDLEIDTLFIDGNHDHACSDFEAWRPHLKEHSTVAFHDSQYPAVGAAIRLAMSAGFRVVEEVGSLTVLRR